MNGQSHRHQNMKKRQAIKNMQDTGKKAAMAEKKWRQEWQRKVMFIKLEKKIKGKP